MDDIVKDSSIWYNPNFMPPFRCEIMTGIIREEYYNDATDTFFYRVECLNNGRRMTLSCRPLVRFGDVFNYEEFNLRSRISTQIPEKIPTSNKQRVGETVAVAPIGRTYVEGIILGSLKHPARASNLSEDNIAYSSEFNGIETTISDAGAYKLTFKGLPTNSALLSKLPYGAPIPSPIYNPAINGSNFSFDESGNIEIADAALALPQSLKIDKTNGNITIKSGTTTVVLDKTKISVIKD